MKNRLDEINLKSIAPSPLSDAVDDDLVAALSESIMCYGLISPLIVRQISADQYEMIDGHARALALLALGHENVQVVVRNYSDTDAAGATISSGYVRAPHATDFEAWKVLCTLEATGSFKTRREIGTLMKCSPSQVTALQNFRELPIPCLALLEKNPALVGAQLATSIVTGGFALRYPDLVLTALQLLVASRIKRQDEVIAWISEKIDLQPLQYAPMLPEA